MHVEGMGNCVHAHDKGFPEGRKWMLTHMDGVRGVLGWIRRAGGWYRGLRSKEDSQQVSSGYGTLRALAAQASLRGLKRGSPTHRADDGGPGGSMMEVAGSGWP